MTEQDERFLKHLIPLVIVGCLIFDFWGAVIGIIILFIYYFANIPRPPLKQKGGEQK